MKEFFSITVISLVLVTSKIYAVSKEDFCKASKINSCVTSFGTELGQNDGIKAFSNCRSECIMPKPNIISAQEIASSKEIQSGITWQCVEYARRWWIHKYGIVFGSVDTANEIYFLKYAIRIKDDAKISLKQKENSSTFAPNIGDILIYKKQPNNPNFQYGHAAVIVNINLNKEYIDVAEANYDNKMWVSPNNYARRIALNFKNGKYTIYDINYSEFNKEDKENSKKAEMIIGWISPEFK